MAWIITVHDGGGSTVEAAAPVCMFTAANEQDAEQVQTDVQNWLDNQGYSDCWVQCNQLPSNGHTTSSQAVAEVTTHFGTTPPQGGFSQPLNQFLSMMGPQGQAIAQGGGPQFGLMPDVAGCPDCFQTNIPVDQNGLLATHDITPNLRQVCSGSGKQSITEEQAKDGKRAKVKREKEEAERKQAEFDAYIAKEHGDGITMLIVHEGQQLILEHKLGIPLAFQVGRRLQLMYNHDDPLDPANGQKYDVTAYIKGVRRKGKPSVVVHEVKNALPKAQQPTGYGTTADVLEQAKRNAEAMKEQWLRDQRLKTVEPTDDIPDDIKAQLAALMGGKSDG